MSLHLGKIGENLAIDYLKKNFFKIKDKNWRTKWGEIDIVAEKEKIIYFIEVKTRLSTKAGKPYEAVNHYKIQAIKKNIQSYLYKKKIYHKKLAFAVIGINLFSDLTIKEIKFYNYNEIF